MHFGGVWLDNSVSIKLPKLETGSARVPGFGMKQVIAIQQHLDRTVNCSVGKTALLFRPPGAMYTCFFGEWVQVLFRKL